MYIIYSDATGHSVESDSLEGLRLQLVVFHLRNRRYPQFGDFTDQYLAVYPSDESEKDGDEPAITPRDLTSDLLIQLAGFVWDTPYTLIQLREYTTLEALATTVGYLFNVDSATAHELASSYSTQLKASQRRVLNPTFIFKEDADSIIESIKTDRATGTLTTAELTAVANATLTYRQAMSHADDLRDKRDSAINAAVAAGATKASVARAAGVSKQAIAKILRRDSN